MCVGKQVGRLDSKRHIRNVWVWRECGRLSVIRQSTCANMFQDSRGGLGARCTSPGPGDPSAEPRAVSRRTDLRTARFRARRAAAAATAHVHTHAHARTHARTRRTRTRTRTHTDTPRRLPASPPPPHDWACSRAHIPLAACPPRRPIALT
jgi:hypothetical protein